MATVKKREPVEKVTKRSAKKPTTTDISVRKAASTVGRGRTPTLAPDPISKAGSRLTPEVEFALSSEAEDGYDLDRAVARPVGRPSLSNRSGPSRRIQARISDDEFAALDELARARGKRTSTLLRDLVRDYLDRAGSRQAS